MLLNPQAAVAAIVEPDPMKGSRIAAAAAPLQVGKTLLSRVRVPVLLVNAVSIQRSRCKYSDHRTKDVGLFKIYVDQVY